MQSELSEKYMKNMKKEVKDKWLEALRSGKYKQGRGFLKQELLTEEGFCYCVLGVLCEVIKEEVGLTEETRGSVRRFDGLTASLPKQAQLYTGLYSQLPQVRHKQRKVSIASLNDIGMPFSELADIIEKQF